jgi:hypothetical protein
MILDMPSILGWKTDVPLKNQEALNSNNRIAQESLFKVLLARWIVFCTFVEEAKTQNAGVLPDSIKHDWLLFQIHSSVASPARHPFITCISTCLDSFSFHEVKRMLASFDPKSVLGDSFGEQTSFTKFWMKLRLQVAPIQMLSLARTAKNIVLSSVR